MPCNPGLIPRLPVRAHGFTTQNAFDGFDPHLAMRSRRVSKSMKNPTPSWNTLAARLSPPPVTVMGCLLELVSLRASSAAACAAHDRDASRQDASRLSLQPT